MIRPTPRMIALVALGLIPALLPVFLSTSLWFVVLVYNSILVLAFLADLILSPGVRELDLVVSGSRRAYVGAPIELNATMSSGRRSPHFCELRIEHSGPVGDAEAPTQSEDPETWVASLPTTTRGMVRIIAAHLRWSGRLNLAHRSAILPQEITISVVPDIRSVKRAAVRLATHHTFLTGLKTRRIAGDGSEFETLRLHVAGLDPRQIDWKASARHRKLLSRENRSERNHRIVLALDAGRLMCEPIQGTTKLDHAINAGLLLSYLSLKMGDRVGMLAFDATVQSFIAPHGGINTMQKLSQAGAAIEYSALETNYTLALTTLGARLRRRSIVIILTDFTDTISAEIMVENLTRLARKHLVIFAAIRDPSTAMLVNVEPTSSLDINKSIIATELQNERRRVLQLLQRGGVLCVDGEPEQMSIDLINKYLDVHRRELV